jgi:hypothetical protein
MGAHLCLSLVKSITNWVYGYVYVTGRELLLGGSGGRVIPKVFKNDFSHQAR